ncbi:MAG: hypothetical protein PWR13_1000 [Archaeoglobi archaeon]|nr:hypothetical protein [Archaeoglobi archaeon]
MQERYRRSRSTVEIPVSREELRQLERGERSEASRAEPERIEEPERREIRKPSPGRFQVTLEDFAEKSSADPELLREVSRAER